MSKDLNVSLRNRVILAPNPNVMSPKDLRQRAAYPWLEEVHLTSHTRVWHLYFRSAIWKRAREWVPWRIRIENIRMRLERRFPDRWKVAPWTDHTGEGERQRRFQQETKNCSSMKSPNALTGASEILPAYKKCETAMNILDLPFNQFVGLAFVQRDGRDVVYLEPEDHHLNHVGTIHAAGSIFIG